MTSDHYPRSNGDLGRMENGQNGDCIKVEASIPSTCINLLPIERYERLIEDTYKELQNEDILGCYLHQRKGEEHPEPHQRAKKKVLKRKEVARKDIQNFFDPVSTVSSSKRNKTNKAIIKIYLNRKERSLLCNILYDL